MLLSLANLSDISACITLYIMQWVRLSAYRFGYCCLKHPPISDRCSTQPSPLQKNKQLICCSHNNMLYIHLCRFYMVLQSSFRFCFCVYMCRIHGFLLCIYPSVRVSFTLTPYYYFYLCIKSYKHSRHKPNLIIILNSSSCCGVFCTWPYILWNNLCTLLLIHTP